jgi:MinD-like ATPase involved in chromosome partitioning or flagellar assembly
MNSAEQHRQRVTVVSPFGQHQVDLPVDVPVSGFLPDLLAMTGLHPSQARAGSAGWQLEDADGQTLPADSTLAAHGIPPGAVIQLRGTQPAGPGLPRPGGPAGNGQDSALLSRHVPRSPAPSGPPEDSLTPVQRAEAVLPQRVGRVSRVLAAAGAYFQNPALPMPRDPAEYFLSAAETDALPGQAGPPGAVPGQPGDGSGQPGDGPPGDGAPGLGPDQARALTAPPPRPRTPGRHRLLPSDLTVESKPTRMERARAQWRETDHLGRLDARITQPRLRHCATIAVVSPKGGVGKTTVTALLGTLFSLLRRDPTVAVDTNPDFGSLGRVLTPDQSWYVDDLARLVTEDEELSLTALDSQLGRAIHGLLVVPAPTDPVRMSELDEDSYRRVITRLKDFFSLILLDCGTGLQDPASAAAIAAADQVVLLTDAQPATASLVAQSADLLHQSGRPITVVVNRMPARGGRLDLDRLSRYLPAARGLVVIPDQVPAATRLAGGGFDWRDAPDGWQLALRQLAVVLVSDWRRLGLAQ